MSVETRIRQLINDFVIKNPASFRINYKSMKHLTFRKSYGVVAELLAVEYGITTSCLWCKSPGKTRDHFRVVFEQRAACPGLLNYLSTIEKFK